MSTPAGFGFDPMQQHRPEPYSGGQSARTASSPLRVVAAVLGSLLILGGAGVLGGATFDVVHAQPSEAGLGSPNSGGEYGHQQLIGSSATENLDVTPATAEQKLGVVTILTELYYDAESQAAGTGMVLTADGDILTNNHVIQGATSIEVTIESTGEVYSAEIVGTDATKDVALLHLVRASNLDTVTLNLDDEVQVADEVASIGNARGTGDLVVAAGFVSAVGIDADIGDEYSDEFESLTNLIEISADVVSGDSGGPLVNASGEVVGMVTAASGGFGPISGFAVTIGDAMSVVDQIRAGDDSGTVRIGPSAFMGVQLDQNQDGTGVLVAGPIPGTPAADAGLAEGDLITSIDGIPVLEIDELTGIIDSHAPGDTIVVTYTDVSGAEHTVPITLARGPA